MIEKFFSMFQNIAVHKMAFLTTICSQVISSFEREFLQDLNARDAAIDTLIDLLQKHKTTVPLSVTPEVKAPVETPK